MRHVDYVGWTEFLQSVMSKHDISLENVLELAAGTGKFASSGLYHGAKRVVLSDLSFSMLRQSLRVCKSKEGTRFVATTANALNMPFKGEFSSIWMLYDSLNYLLDAEGLENFFTSVYSHLKPKGYFVADVTTAINSQRYFSDFLDWEENEECSMVRESNFDNEKKMQTNRFVLFVKQPDGSYSRCEEVHRQRIYPWKEFVTIAKKAGLVLQAAYHNHTLQPAKNNSERVHLVWQRL